MDRNIQILWALKSNCNMRCRYCYFSKEESNNLSYDNKNDLDINKILQVIKNFNKIKRVFIAGGEPLIYNDTFELIKILKEQKCQVVLCTNGLLLNSKIILQKLIDLKIDAISISLDSYDENYTNFWRQSLKKENVFGNVVTGISKLIKIKDEQRSKLKVGIYSVLTKNNISHLEKTYTFINNLGVDYYVFQPVSLEHNNKYYMYSLNVNNKSELKEAVIRLKEMNLKCKLPNDKYLEMLIETLDENKTYLEQCICKNNLYFITPDGLIWNCPSSKYINTISANFDKSILDVFELNYFNKHISELSCNLYSKDCINVYQLINFDEFL